MYAPANLHGCYTKEKIILLLYGPLLLFNSAVTGVARGVESCSGRMLGSRLMGRGASTSEEVPGTSPGTKSWATSEDFFAAFAPLSAADSSSSSTPRSPASPGASRAARSGCWAAG